MTLHALRQNDVFCNSAHVILLLTQCFKLLSFFYL